MLSWDHPKRNSKLPYEVPVLQRQHVEQTYLSSAEENVALPYDFLTFMVQLLDVALLPGLEDDVWFYVCSDVTYKETQTLEIRGVHRSWKTAWDERPPWMRTVYSGKEGDNTVLETVVNVATSIPFVVIGLRVPRKSFSTTMYSNSLIGVGMASTLYHTSRGEARKGTRWGDYAMIATSSMCMSSAVQQQDSKHSKALMLASVMMLPFQPLLVAAMHTGLAEATFARKVIKDPKLRGAHALHTASSLVGGALFIADDVFPDAPYIHAAWHLAAAVGVMTINSLID